MIVVVIFALINCVSAQMKNYAKNPGFEEGNGKSATHWAFENGRCERTSDDAHSGNYCVHCKDDITGYFGIYSFVYDIMPGFKYNCSCWIKMKDVTNGNFMLVIEGQSNAGSGMWPTSSQIEDCKSGTCKNKWYKVEQTISSRVFTNQTYYITPYLSPYKAMGEYWVDDITFEIVVENYLYSVDVISWRQEVFEREVEVRVATNFNGTAFENGDYCQFQMDVFDKHNKKVQSTNEFQPRMEFQQIVVSMPLYPKDLLPGYYTLRVAFYNNITENLETVVTKFRKLEKERTPEEYKTFVDVDNRCFVDGKLFFPLGCFMNWIDDYDLANFTGSPFNLMLSYPVQNKAGLDKIYEKTNGQIRVINNFAGCLTWKKSEYESKKNYAKKLINEWKDSPGLFGYYIADEPGVQLKTIMSELTWVVRENDPHHVVWPAVNQRFQLGHLKEGFDTVGIDCYPLQSFEALEDIWVMTDQGRKRMGNSRAMWNIPQIFDWEVYRYDPGFEKLHNNWAIEKPPTEYQLKNMVYQWIVGGGMGLIMYDYSEMIDMNHKSPFVDEWKKVQKVINHLKHVWVPVIQSNIKPNPDYFFNYHDFVDPIHYVGVRHFRNETADYILIVNVRQTAHTYTFFKPKGVTVTKIEGTSTMTVDEASGKVTLTMPSADVVWIKGTGGTYKHESIDINIPNLKSKFDPNQKIVHEYPNFPKLPDVPDDPTAPPRSPDNNENNTSGSLSMMISLIIMIFIFII